MAFFGQLRLLLWKNCLAVIRQPLWSLTLLAWPLIIFLIILVTRHQFPPVVKDTCYVSPRNLPSAGFFPFLQTLMCNTDSTCRNTSSLVDPTDPKSFQPFSGNTRSAFLQKSAPLVNLLQGGSFFNFSFQNDSSIDHAQMASFLNNIFGPSLQESINNISLGNDNATLLGDQETLNNILESVNLVKRAMCTMTLPMINSTSSNPLNYAALTFCKSNSSVFEVSLLTFNQILTDLMLTKPNETVATAATSALMFDQLQNHTTLWESLLDIPQLFSSSSDQMLNSTKSLLTNLQGAVAVFQNNMPVANATLSAVHPLLVGGINTIHYAQNWPGKGVSIPLGEIVTLQNDSLSVMVKAVLQEVQIPLDKAIGLTLDKTIVHSYLCDNSNKSLLLTAACSTGTVGMVLDWISPEMVAKQALLAWSKDVAPHDVSFIKGVLQSLIGGSSPGGQGGSTTARKRRSIDVQPQSIEEELFLSVGQVVMEVLQIAPEVDLVVQSILRTGFQAMNAATLALNTAAEIMASGLKDADQLQQTYLQLMTNETQASIWIDHVLDNVIGIVIKILESNSLTCEDFLSSFAWLLNTETIKTEMWTSMICQNSSTLQPPLAQDTQNIYSNLTAQADYNVTLPIILAEWQKLANSSLQFKTLSEKVMAELDGEYWMNWMVDNSTFDVYETLLQSYGLFVGTFGENIETIDLWPEVKNYFDMAYWILNYRPGVTSQPENCSIDSNFTIHCNTSLNWPHFTELVKEAMVSPNTALVSSIEGTVNLLQYVYGNVYKNLTESFLKQEFKGEDALSAYLGNLTHDLNGFFHNVSNLPYSNNSNPGTMLPFLHNMLETTSLSPLLDLFLGDSPLNVSIVLEIASKLGRVYLPIITSNETDPIMLDLEQLIMQFLSLEGNLTLPISHVLSYSLLNYSEYFSLDDVNHLTEVIQPLANQTSPSLVEMIFSAIKLWKTVMDSSNGDPENITLIYIHQLRELAVSLFRVQENENFLDPSGKLNITQANQISDDIVKFLSPESLLNLTQAGPDAAQSIVIQKFVGFLPPEVQKEAFPIIQELRNIEHQFSECATGQNCLTQVSEIFQFLNQILDLIHTANGNLTHEIPENITGIEGYKNMTSMFFSLLLSKNNDGNVTMYNQTLQFISMAMARPNISVSEIKTALKQSNLTLADLENIAVLAQTFNISDLLNNIIIVHDTFSARQCFEPQQDSVVTAKCVMKLINGMSCFLRQLPNFQNETLLVHIPSVINKTISDMIQVNFNSSTDMIYMQTLYSTLANIKMNLQLNQLNTSEIMTELEMLQDLIQLYSSMEPPLNSSLMRNPIYAQKVNLEIVEWYLKRLENTTSNSSFSDLLHPFFYLTQMQITLQLAQTEFSSYVSNHYNLLMNSLHYPIDGPDVSKIGETVADILQHLSDLIDFNLEVQNTNLHSELFNTTILNATELQIRQYLDLIQKWMIQPNVSLALTGMLDWGNYSMNTSTHLKDMQQLLITLDNFLSDDQQTYLSGINNITQYLRKALMLAEKSGGLQSDDFSDTILEAVKNAMQLRSEGTELLDSTQKNILEVVQESLKLIVQPGMSFASSRNISRLILKAAEKAIQLRAPDMISEYIMYGLKVATTYIETTSTADMPDVWSQMIVNEMKMFQAFLPQNFTAKDYVSVLINITYSLLESNGGNMSLWSSFENATMEDMPQILDQMGQALDILWPLVMEGPGSFEMSAPSLKNFAYLAPVLEQVMARNADQDTWKNLKMVFESLLSTLEETEIWSNVTAVIPHIESLTAVLVNIEQAENAMIESLQMPVLTLIKELVQSANTTHLNLSDVSERMQLAVDSTANLSLECGDVLKEWEPVREAAGLSHTTMAMWCNISLQPVLEAYAAAQTLNSHLNLSHMGVGPVNRSDAAARIVNTVQSLYLVSINQRLVTVQLIRAFSDHLSMLSSHPLSPEAQLYWNKQLQDEQFLNSLSSIKLLSDELLNMAPYIRPFFKAMEKAVHYTLHNCYIIQNSSTFDEPLGKTAGIFLAAVNTTLDNMFSIVWRNLSGQNESTIVQNLMEAFELLKNGGEFRDGLTQYLAFEDRRAILQKVAEITAWLASTEANITSDNIYSMILGNMSGLNETSFTNMMREAVNLLSEEQIFGEEPMIYEDLEKFLASNEKRAILQNAAEIFAWLASMEANITSDNIFSMVWRNWFGLNETSFTNVMREAVNMLSERQVFGEEPMIYEDLEKFLASNNKRVILQNAAEIIAWLASMEANITSEIAFPMVWGNWSGLNETSFTFIMREAVKHLSEQQIFGDEPMIYEALEEFLASNDKMVILQNVAEITAWLASTESNITSDNIFPMVWGNWSGLSETPFQNMTTEAVRLLSERQIFGDEPFIYHVLQKFVESNGKGVILQKVVEITTWLASVEANITSHNIFPMTLGNWSGVNDTSFTHMMMEAVEHLRERQVFGDDPIIYQVFAKFLTSSDQKVILQKVPEITAWLASIEANVTSDNITPMIWGNWSGPNDTCFTNMMRKAVQLLSDQQIFGVEPMIYQALEQFLASNDKRVSLQNLAQISTWLASMEGNITLDNIFPMVWGNWSALNETSLTNMMRDAVNLLIDQHIFGDEPMIYQALENAVAISDERVLLQKVAEITEWLASRQLNMTLGNTFSMISGNWSGLNETSLTYMIRKAVKLLSDQQVFGNESMISQALEEFLTSNNTVVLHKVAEITAWLASSEANFTSDNILSIMWEKWSGLNETAFTNLSREVVKLLRDQQIFGDEPLIYQDLEQFLAHSDKSLFLHKVAEISTWMASFEANITLDNIFSKIYFDKIMIEAVKLLKEQQMFGDEPMMYEALEKFLISSNEKLILQKLSEISACLAYIEANITLENLSMTWENWSGLNDTSFISMMNEAIQILSRQQILGDEPKIYQTLEHLLASNNKTKILLNVAEIAAWLASNEANTTSDNIYSRIWGNWSGPNDTSFTNMVREAVKLLSDRQIFGDEPQIYQSLEQFLASRNKSMLLQTMSGISTWLASLKANITSDNIYTRIWESWSGLNETSFSNMMREVVNLLIDQHLFGNDTMIYQALEQFLTSNNKMEFLQKATEITAWLTSIESNMTSDNIYTMIWRHWSGLNETSFTKLKKEALKLLNDQQPFENNTMIYQALEQFMTSSDKAEILQKAAEITAWLASIESNISSDSIYSMILGNLSVLNETSFTSVMMEAVRLLSNQHLFGNDTLITQALEQFLTSNKKIEFLQKAAEFTAWLASSDENITSENIYSMIWGHLSGLNETSFTNMIQEAEKLLSNQQMFENDTIIHQVFKQFIQLDNTSLNAQTLADIRTWFASIEASDNVLSMFLGNLSSINETTFVFQLQKTLNMLTDRQIFGDKSIIFQTLEKFLASNNTSFIAQNGMEMTAWLTSTEANITSDKIFSLMWGDLSVLTETHFTDMTREAVKLMSDLQIFGDEPMIYQDLEQFLASSNASLMVKNMLEIIAWLPSTDKSNRSDIFSMLLGNFSQGTETKLMNMILELFKLNASMSYQGLEQYLPLNNTSLLLQKMANISFWLASANITSDNLFSMMWGNFSGLNETFSSNIMWEAIQLMTDLQIFGDVPMVYQILGSNDTTAVAQKLAEMYAWLSSTEAAGLDLLIQSLTKICEISKPFFSVLKQINEDMQGDMELLKELADNILTMIRLLESSPPLPVFQHLGGFQQEILVSNYTIGQNHEAQLFKRNPMDDFINLFYLNYPAMFEAISAPPTTEDITETVHMFFNNPNLSVVLKGASVGIPWGLNASREETIDAALGMLSSITLPDTSQKPFMVTLTNAVEGLPDDFPLSSLLKNLTRALVTEYKENLNLTQLIIETATNLPQMNLTDPQFTEQLHYLRSKVCTLENTESVRLLMLSLSMEPGQLCDTFLPSLEILLESVIMNMTSLTESIFQAVIGDPSTYNVQPTWTSVLSQRLGVNITSLSSSLNINISSAGKVTFGELLRNETAFVLDVQQRVHFDPAFLSLLMEATLPDKNMEILSWIVNLRHCGPTPYTSDIILETFCSMSIEQWYTFSLLMTRHINTEKVFYRVVLSEELQGLLEVMLVMAKTLSDMMEKMLPAIGQLQNFMISIQDLNLVANNEFKQMTRGRRSISSQATFATLSRALCSNNIKALFDITKPTVMTEATYLTVQQREDLIERFNIPRNATSFCTDLYLDMVNSTGGAIAWAFLKPMLMGQILYTPDTPVTRDIMEKANGTLQEFANLKKNSEDWIKASEYIIDSSKLLSSTLPMLQNSLANSFVKSFIEMQTDINVDRMKETLNSFSNVTSMLEQNKYILKQITTLSNLMVDLSSCVKFDRYRGFNSADELDKVAQELAKKRDLYASVIFKLPENQNSTNRPSRSLFTSFTSSLPPKVSYTIRMHMDNVMRTDRVRDPYFVKDHYILARRTMRYNRGFIYLQESIDRAIIEAQVGQKVTEPAVQLQPFPYPCFQRDEFLQAISYVFPIMLMIAWVLFVADFVKKLVHERELRLHEYMKMMGVNPLSHFFAWFLECAAHLLLTIFILTLILKYGKILPNSDGFILFLFLCDYGLSILAFSYLVSSFFDKTYIAGLSGSLLYILCFFPYIMVIALETNLTFSQKSALGLFAPTCFSYASQYVSRYESQGEGIHWSNSYTSPIAGDTASFGWLCWLMFIDSILYFIIGAYVRMVLPGKYGIPAPWYFPFTASFWSNLFCCVKSERNVGRGLLITNIMQRSQSVFPEDKGKDKTTLATQAGEDYSHLPVGVSLHGLSKLYDNRAAIENLNVSFYEGHVTSLLGHNGAGKTTTMSLLTGLFPPSSGTIEVYGKDMQINIEDVRKELGVCMQYDVLFDHLTTKEHLLLYGQIKAPHWSAGELHEQVRSILEETGMYAHRHKLVGTLSGGMKRKLSISIAFIGGSRLVVLDEPTTGVDPCSRRSIWDIVIQNKKHRTIIMSTHHLDEAEVLSDRIAFLERGGLKCCGSPFYLKDKLGQGYKLTLNKKPQMENTDSERIDNAELKAFVQAHVPEARLKDTQGGDMVYSLPPFTSSNASSYRSLLTALDSNLEDLQLGGYGISDTTLEEVFLQLTRENSETEGGAMSMSETASIDSFSSDLSDNISNFSDRIMLTGTSVVRGMALTWQQIIAMLIKRFHHSRRDWKGLISQILLPVLFMVFAMCLGLIKSDLQNYPDMELSPALYNIGPSYSFFRNLNPNSSKLVETMTSFPGIDNVCLDNSDNPVCKRSTSYWTSSGNSSKPFNICKCTRQEQICDREISQLPFKQIPSSQIVYNLSGFNVETYLIATANDFIRNRYGGFDFGMPLPSDLQMDLQAVPKNRTLSKIWYNPEGFHTMPAYLNSLSNIILRSNLPADKDPRQYAISVSSHPYFGRADDDDIVIQGMLQILVAVCVLTGYSITTTSFAIYEVKEHHSGSKRLQHITGISEPLYWTVNFFYDMVVYMIPVTLTVCVIAAFQIPAFTDRQNLAAITLLLVLFGFATFPWMYLLSEVFKDAEMAFITFVCINLFITVNTIMSTSILYFLGQLTTRNTEAIMDIFNKLSQAFLIFPQFNFGNGLLELTRMNIEVQLLSGYGIDAYKSPFSTDSLGWMFISSFIQGMVFFTLRLLLNKSLMRKVRDLICSRKTVPQVPIVDDDEDVAAEHLRVCSGGASSDILQVNKLTKVYQHLKKKVYAVKRISVGIPAGECFGLLGVNGAGKTTTFKMLTGDVSPTDGTAQTKDWDGRLVDIMECRDKGINIGYCPQVDALDSLLTGAEHLYFYARIRGISKKEIDGVVNYLLKRLELNYHKNIISDSYSCGTRRKLSTALALIGHPQILLLDEPSSGMDPRTKRHLWKIISEEVKGKCAVVLTSHSMEECEALCSRLAIMVKGQFRCLGSLQHIKNRFGSGFTVKMYMTMASVDAAAITAFMQRKFPSTYLKDQHSNMLEYHIPIAPGGVADIFDQLESNKNALQIKHFSVSQTTLDEVFINFATGKVGMDSIPIQSEDEDLDSIEGVEK